jgi:hypothetical protein
VRRRPLFVLALAATRIRRRFGSTALAAAGIAAGAAAFAAVLGAATAAQDESLTRAVSRLPAAQRAVRASWFGAYDPSLNATAVRALRGITEERPLRAFLLRQTSVDGKVFNLGAADRLARWVRVRSGRLPHGCTPRRCEVLQVAGAGPLPDVPGLRLRRVGVGDLVSTVPFLQTTAYGRTVEDSYSFTSPQLTPPFLLTDDVSGAESLPIFRLIHRSSAWIVPLRPRSLHPWGLDDLRRGIERARSDLTTGSFFFDLSDPVSELEPVAESGRVTAHRLLLVGGQAAALLLAFAALAAASRRRESELTGARLARFGARGWQLALLSAAEAGGLAVLATVGGWLVGSGIAAAIADGAGAPVGAVLRHSALSGGGVALGLGLAALAAAVLLVALHAPVVELGRIAVTPLDVAAVGAAAAIVLALARGAADAETLADGGGNSVLLFLLPALIGFVAAVVAVRLLGPLARGLERLSRRLPVAGRLAALSIARNAGFAGAVAAFLLVSVGFAAFSVAYRATLAQGQSDQARFQTPPDVVLQRTAAQPLPLVAPRLEAAYKPLAKRAVPVLRLQGQVGSDVSSRQLTVLGLPSAAIRTLPFWRSDFASSSPRQLAAAVDPGRPTELQGVRLPAAAQTLALTIRERGDPFVVTANIAARNGTFVPVDFGTVEPPGKRARVALPKAARGGLIVGLTFAPTLPEVHNARPAAGRMELARLSAGPTILQVDFDSWLSGGGIRGRTRGRTARLSFFLTNETAGTFRPRQPTDAAPLGVIASPEVAALAGSGGMLPLRIADADVVAHVAANARRFPSTHGDVVVADEGALATALNSAAPGTAQVGEIWLEGVSRADARRLRAALTRPALAGVRATFRARVEADLREDPLARAVLRTFATIALVALFLAVAGLALAVAGDLRDEGHELRDLEEQGAGPRLLRRHVRLRSAGVVGLGICGGAVLAAILSVLVVDAVLVTANGGSPDPPLVLAVDWRALTAGLALYVAVALVVVTLLTWNAFRREAAT